MTAGTSSLPGRYWRDDRLDWDQLAADAVPSSYIEGALMTRGGDAVARSALTLLLGEAFWTSTANHSILHGPVNEPTLSILRMVRPAAALDECRRVLLDGQPDERLNALHLLADLAEISEIDLVPELLRDHDPRIQIWAAVLLKNILFTCEVDPPDTELLIREMETHPNEGVRATAENIREIQAGYD
jgi:hypothetical protein